MSDQGQPKEDREWAKWLAEQVFKTEFMTVEKMDELGILELIPDKDWDKGHWDLHDADKKHIAFFTQKALVKFLYSFDGYVATMYALSIKLHGAENVNLEKVRENAVLTQRHIKLHYQSLHHHAWDVWHDPHWNKDLK